MELWKRDAGRIAFGVLLGMLATFGYFCSEIRRASELPPEALERREIREAPDAQETHGAIRDEREAGTRALAR